MTLSLTEIKELISFGQEIGLQQLQTEGLVVVYGARPLVQSSPLAGADGQTSEQQEEIASITEMYRSAGRAALQR